MKTKAPASYYKFLTPDCVSTSGPVDGHGRSTQLTYGPPLNATFIRDPDEVFADAVNYPEILADTMLWHIIKPWLKNSASEVELFWASFDDESATEERMIAINGLKSVNWAQERVLIRLVHTLKQLERTENESPGESMFQTIGDGKLSAWVKQAVLEDPNALIRLNKLIKDPTAADDKTNRDLTSRNILKSFMELVAKTERLPSKKQVRENAYLGSDDDARVAFSKWAKKLGLSGLPRG